MKNKSLLLLVLVVLILSACSAPSTKTPGQMQITVVYQTSTPDPNAPYPVEPNALDEHGAGYPVEGVTPSPMPESTALPLVAPVVDAQTASVYGKVYSLGNSDLVLSGVLLYVADMVPVEPQGGYIYSIQEKSSPHTETDSAGQFVFSGLQAKKYTLILKTPMGSFPLVDAEKHEQIMLDLKPGDVVNLGLVYVNWP